MSIIRTWAAQWGVPLEAIAVLESRLGIDARSVMYQSDSEQFRMSLQNDAVRSEAYQQSLVRLEAGRLGVRLFRNNSGALRDKDGRLVRFGLGNDSKQVNDVFKSPDLVGWRALVITPDMIGSKVAQTVLREMKAEDWQYSGDAHEQAQLNFINLCVADGGDARFCTGPGTL